jgi:hypothetical protein
MDPRTAMLLEAPVGGGLFPLKGVPQDSNPLARAEPSNVETPSARLLKHCSLINCAFQFVSSESLAVAEFDHIRLANGRLERAHNRVEDLAAIASG